MDQMTGHAPVLIAGFGVFGSTVGRLLRAKHVDTTVLDYDSDRVDLLRELGLEVYYGDATRLDLLEVAGARDARLLVVAMPDPATTLKVVRTARKHFPELRIFARAFDWTDARTLRDEGVEAVYRQSLDTGLRAGRDALSALGFRAYQAQRATRTFLRHEEESLDAIAQLEGEDRSKFVSTARARIEDLERVLRLDLEDPDADRDRGWDPESLREEYAGE